MSQALIKAAPFNCRQREGLRCSQASTNIEDIYKEDIGGAALIQVTYASRKAFRGKAQLFAKGDIGGLIVRNDDTDQSRVSKP